MFLPTKDKVRALLHIRDESKARKVFDIVATFCLVAYGWMLFYAPNMQFIVDVTKGYFNLGMPYIHQTTIFFFGIGFMILLMKDFKDEFYFDRISAFAVKHSNMACFFNYIKYAVLAVLIVWIGVLGGGQFIYFKF